MKLFEAIKAGKFKGYTSQYVIDELKRLVKLHEMQEDFSAAIFVQNKIVELLKKRYAGYEKHSVLTEEKNYLANLRERIT